ncbi:MAG: hypothetical protein AB9Q19_01345 [Candidatus Reddybacter sp.]
MANEGGSYTADKDGSNKILVHRTADRGPVAPPEQPAPPTIAPSGDSDNDTEATE